MGSVIRRESLSGRPVFSFADIEQQAQAILARAEARAQKIVAESEGRIRAITEAQRHEAYDAGWAEGRQAGFEQARTEARAQALRNAEAELRQLTTALQTALGEFDQRKRGLLALAESGLIDLALAIARRVCKVQVEASPAVAQANARALLEMVQNQHDVELHFNPAECELAAADVPAFLADVRQRAHVSVVSDPQVARGGCVLATPDGVLDASIAEQLERVAEALAGHGHAATEHGHASAEEPS